MRVDRKWVERNLGFDPIATPPPDATFASVRAAKAETPEDFQREIIDFDSESPAGLQFMAFSTATGLSRYTDVEWPKGLAPKIASAALAVCSDASRRSVDCFAMAFISPPSHDAMQRPATAVAKER